MKQTKTLAFKSRYANQCPACLGRGIIYWASMAGQPRNAWCDSCNGTGSRRFARRLFEPGKEK